MRLIFSDDRADTEKSIEQKKYVTRNVGTLFHIPHCTFN